MKDSEVYLKAAELVDCGKFASCFAVNQIVSGIYVRESTQAINYANLFSPSLPVRKFTAWGERWGDLHYKNNDDEIKSCRVLALLFMHQIALDDERKAKRRKVSRK